MTFIVPPPHGPSLPDAILIEVGAKLKLLAETGAASAIELRGLPLSLSELETLDAALGRGEVQAEVHLSGLSTVSETAWPGVWRVRHHATGGDIIADEIIVAAVPDILAARPDDITEAAARFLTVVQAQCASTGENEK